VRPSTMAVPNLLAKCSPEKAAGERTNSIHTSSRVGTGRLRGRLTYAARMLPRFAWHRLTRPRVPSPVHLIIALADHFEPAIAHGAERVAYDEQERRMERWCREYPKLVDGFRDSDGGAFSHTYFYPAEQYDRALIERLAEHCHSGWGEIEIHLHHGTSRPDTAENTARVLTEFRDVLANVHQCLSYVDGSGSPRYAFVHGNFALANSNGGRGCGVDSEIDVLAKTGCYADMTMPAGPFHRAQTGKINSLYECNLPLQRRAAHAHGRDLVRGRMPEVLPIMVQGPFLFDFSAPSRAHVIDNGAMTTANPPTLRRLRAWKEAGISVRGRPDWLFLKLHCHGMDPTQEDVMLGSSMRSFLHDLVPGAPQRGEHLHFVTAREMVNIILAACAGREGNPGEFRDYRYKLERTEFAGSRPGAGSERLAKG
jgi:hypothetical protein